MKKEIKENEYQCASCGGVFEKGWSDEEAENEVAKIWGEIPQGERVVICDVCFNKRTPTEIKQMGEEYRSKKLSTPHIR